MTPGRSRRVALGFVFLAGSAAAVAFWWLTRFGAPPPGTGLGREVFLGKGRCATCHTLGAGAPPGRGPDLAGVGGRAATRVAGLDAAGYLLESLVQPNAFTVPGYPA
ncbi:MAG: hypothetical protein HZA54_07020, partial [Planctomycetes bacterium]|nr:hypothetical protein [Planctomycetota bacterium]